MQPTGGKSVLQAGGSVKRQIWGTPGESHPLNPEQYLVLEISQQQFVEIRDITPEERGREMLQFSQHGSILPGRGGGGEAFQVKRQKRQKC